MVIFAYSILGLGANWIGMIAFILSPPVIHSLLKVNLDWLSILDFALFPWLGIFYFYLHQC